MKVIQSAIKLTQGWHQFFLSVSTLSCLHVQLAEQAFCFGERALNPSCGYQWPFQIKKPWRLGKSAKEERGEWKSGRKVREEGNFSLPSPPPFPPSFTHPNSPRFANPRWRLIIILLLCERNKQNCLHCRLLHLWSRKQWGSCPDKEVNLPHLQICLPYSIEQVLIASFCISYRSRC